MNAAENVAVIRRLYEAFAAQDLEAITSTFSEDVLWHEGGSHQLAGEHRGLAAVMALNARAAELTDGTLSVEVHDILGSEDHVAILQRVSASRNGRRYSLEEILIVHLTGGRVQEVWVTYTDPPLAAAVFG